jgi:hypothetical protein
MVTAATSCCCFEAGMALLSRLLLFRRIVDIFLPKSGRLLGLGKAEPLSTTFITFTTISSAAAPSWLIRRRNMMLIGKDWQVPTGKGG